MDVPVFVQGVGIGAAVAAPVGPMAILCMRRTLAQGWSYGFATGLGIATADGVYASVAALGLAGFARFMLAYDRPLHALAGLFLLYLGLKTLFARPSGGGAERPAATRSPLSGFGSAFLLTMTNPPTIVSFAALFAFLSRGMHFELQTSLLTVAGVVTGSALWWLVLTGVVYGVRHAVGPRVRGGIDVVSGLMLGAFGVVELRRAIVPAAD